MRCFDLESWDYIIDSAPLKVLDKSQVELLFWQEYKTREIINFSRHGRKSLRTDQANFLLSGEFSQSLFYKNQPEIIIWTGCLQSKHSKVVWYWLFESRPNRKMDLWSFLELSLKSMAKLWPWSKTYGEPAGRIKSHTWISVKKFYFSSNHAVNAWWT